MVGGMNGSMRMSMPGVAVRPFFGEVGLPEVVPLPLRWVLWAWPLSISHPSYGRPPPVTGEVTMGGDSRWFDIPAARA